MKTLLFILLFVSSSVSADDWSALDNSLQGIYRLTHVADWQQTLEITESEKYHESNIFLGEQPNADKINLYFAGTLFTHYQISRAIKNPYRNYWQAFWILMELSYVRHNERNSFEIGSNNINNFKIGFNRRF